MLQKEIKKAQKEGRCKPSTLDHTNAVKNAYNDVLKGASYSYIMDRLQSGDYGYTYKKEAANAIVASVRDMLMIDFEYEKPFIKQKFFAMLNDIYTDCREANDRTNAINCVKEMSKLMGLYDDAKSRQSVTVKTENEEITISFNLDNDDDNSITETQETEYEELKE